jgi:hypothetical protein
MRGQDYPRYENARKVDVRSAGYCRTTSRSASWQRRARDDFFSNLIERCRIPR